MDTQDELRALRRELGELLEKAAGLSRRIDAIEARSPGTVTEGPREPERPVAVPPPPPKAPPAPPPQPPPPPFAPELASRKSWLRTTIEEQVAGFQQKTREVGWELSLGTYWIPRIAVVLIAIAVVLFLSLAFKQWGPHMRVGMGYTVCVGLLLSAWRLEKKYAGFARVLYGGGFALSYTVTFATHYVPFARVFETPVVTLILLAALVTAWAVAAQVRRSKVIAVLVTFLGHLTIFLSTVTLDEVSLFSVVGIVFLSMGSAFFLLRNRWYYVAALGIVGSYLNHFVIMVESPPTNSVIDFTLAMGVLSAYLLIFALAELFSPEEIRREKVPVWFRTIYVTANTASFFVLGSLVVHGFDFARDHQDLFRIGAAVALLVIALAYLRRRGRDPLHNVYITKAVVALTLGLAARYGGSTLSAWLAIETVVLLISARRSGLVVTRILALIVGWLALGHGLFSAIDLGTVAYASADYTTYLLQGTLAVFAFLVASQVYQRTDWTVRSPKTAPFAPSRLATCWQLDLIAERPDTHKGVRKPLDGLLFPHLYALAGMALFLAHGWILAEEGHRLLTLAVFALALTAGAILLKSSPFGFASLCLVAVAIPLGASEITIEESALPGFAALAVCSLAATTLCSEKRLLGERPGLAFHYDARIPFFLYGTVAYLLGLVIVREFGRLDALFVLAGVAVVAAGLFLVLHPQALAGVSAALLVWAGVRYLLSLEDGIAYNPTQLKLTPWVLAGVSLGLDRYYAHFKSRIDAPRLNARSLSAVLAGLAWIMLAAYVIAELPDEWLAAGAGLLAFAYLAYGLAFGSRTAVILAGGGTLLASASYTIQAYDLPPPLGPLVVGFVLLAAFWIACERLYARWPKAGGEETKLKVGGALVGLATALLLIMLERIPNIADANLTWVTISWFGFAVCLFLMSLLVNQRLYRYAGLAVILLSLGRVFLIDMRETNAMFRIAAFAVLGAGLLPISYGYFRWLERVRSQRAGQNKNGERSARG